MSLPVIWTTPAKMQLADLHGYISQDNIDAADGQLQLIADATAISRTSLR
jgi:hypothetical protein